MSSAGAEVTEVCSFRPIKVVVQEDGTVHICIDLPCRRELPQSSIARVKNRSDRRVHEGTVATKFAVRRLRLRRNRSVGRGREGSELVECVGAR